MDRPDPDSSPAPPCACGRTGPVRPLPRSPGRGGPTRAQRVLAVATVTAGLLVGLNALVQALNVLAGWWRHAG